MVKHDIYPDRTLKWEHKGEKFLLHCMTDTYPLNPREDFDHETIMACWHGRYFLGDRLPGPTKAPDEFWRELVRKHVSDRELYNAARAGKLPGIRVEKHSGLVDVYETTFIRTALGDSSSSEDLEFEGVSPEALMSYIGDDLTISHCMTLMKPYAEWLPLWLYDHSGITMSCGERTGQYADRWDSGQVGWILLLKEDAINNYGCSRNRWRIKAREVMEAEVEEYDLYLRDEVYFYRLYTYKDDEWQEEDSCGGFLGTDIMANGVIDALGLDGLEEAIESGNYEKGTAKTVTTTHYVFD